MNDQGWDMGSVLNIHMMAHIHLSLLLQGIQHLSPTSMDSYTDKYIPPLPTTHNFKKLLFLF